MLIIIENIPTVRILSIFCSDMSYGINYDYVNHETMTRALNPDDISHAIAKFLHAFRWYTIDNYID